MRVAITCLCALISASLVGGCKKSEPPPPEEAPPQTAESAQPLASNNAANASASAAAGPKADDMKLQTLPAVPIPAENAMSDAKVKLGHQLFFDKRLSVDKSKSCYSCHQNEDGTGGHDPLAIGPKNKQLPRHAPVMWNVGYLPKLYWDGRSNSLEDQAIAAIAGGNMGVGKENLEAKAKEIGKIPGYKKQFDEVFPGKGATPDTIAQALSAYERTLVCDNTAYDKYAKGDKSALKDEEKKGLELFMGKASCVTCHTPPYFSIAYLSKEGAFFNIGIGIEGKKEDEVDVGRMGVTKNASDWAAFKPPTLRNVSKSAPYFHDGSRKKLEDAVRFMASGGYKNKNITPLLADRHLSDEEINSLVAFLGSLECPGKLDEPKLP
jgi:cytochrome c peroxidase